MKNVNIQRVYFLFEPQLHYEHWTPQTGPSKWNEEECISIIKKNFKPHFKRYINEIN